MRPTAGEPRAGGDPCRYRGGYNERTASYVGYYGSEAADTSVLLMPRLGFIGANGPRMRSTVDDVRRQLSVNGLLYRYPPGGVRATDPLP